MSARRQTATVNATARVIQNLAEQNHVTYHVTASDRLAHHITYYPIGGRRGRARSH